MSRTLLSIACHAYGLAAILYLIYLVRQWRILTLIGRFAVAVGLVLHGIALWDAFEHQGGMPLGIGQGLSAVAMALLAIFLALDLRYRKPVFGAFLTPIALAVLVPGLLIHGASGIAPDVRRPLLPVHIAIALLGVAAFAVAAGVAAMYLLMERQVKGKRFGIFFSRLPSLQFLDELNRRLVVAGFILLSVTLATGAFFANGTSGIFWQWRPQEIVAVVAWMIFAAVLGARSIAGWQGRRVAFITMAGFCVLLISLVTSYPLHGGPLR
jgi:ABC-type uncharacterized transport system permease subunit